MIARRFLHTRIDPHGWPIPDPLPPTAAAERISPVPLLIVHGDKDQFFPADHARQLYAAAREPKELWLIPGFGHAERATDDQLTDRIAAWVTEAVDRAGRAGRAAAQPG